MRGRRSDTLRALVMTAGHGTRLRPLTQSRAKAAVPVNGIPLARRVIGWLAAHDIRDLVLNLHHQPASITALIGDGCDMAVRVRYSWEQPVVLGSGGGPRHALPLLVDDQEDTCLLVNGDTLTDMNPHSLLEEHFASGATVTMALIPNARPDKYGGVLVNDENWITGFTKAGLAGPSYHFIGVQAAIARAFAPLEDGVPASSVGGAYTTLMRENPRSVRAHVCDASFQDIGTPADCLETSLALAQVEGDQMRSPSATIHPSAHVTRTALWDDVSVAADAHLTDCIVADGVAVPSGSRFARCAIVPAGSRAPEPDERVEGRLLIRPF
jgi:NDP-sugar pyrophosphorylase family protein